MTLGQTTLDPGGVPGFYNFSEAKRHTSYIIPHPKKRIGIFKGGHHPCTNEKSHATCDVLDAVTCVP